MSPCPRVKARIECPECGYPYSEAMYSLNSVDDPGHISFGATSPPYQPVEHSPVPPAQEYGGDYLVDSTIGLVTKVHHD